MEVDRAWVCKAARASVLDFRGALLFALVEACGGLSVEGCAVDPTDKSGSIRVAPSTGIESEDENVVGGLSDNVTVFGKVVESA